MGEAGGGLWVEGSWWRAAGGEGRYSKMNDFKGTVQAVDVEEIYETMGVHI